MAFQVGEEVGLDVSGEAFVAHAFQVDDRHMLNHFQGIVDKLLVIQSAESVLKAEPDGSSEEGSFDEAAAFHFECDEIGGGAWVECAVDVQKEGVGPVVDRIIRPIHELCADGFEDSAAGRLAELIGGLFGWGFE